MAKPKRSSFLLRFHIAFAALKQAARVDKLALIQCTDTRPGREGQPVPVLALIGKDATGDVTMQPVAQMLEGNPFEYLRPPGDCIEK